MSQSVARVAIHIVRVTFQDEFHAIRIRHGMEVDERYVGD